MAILVSCGGGGGSDSPTTPPPPTPVLTTINVTLAATSIAVGSSTTASAAGLDQNGAAIGIGTVTWSSGATSVASVSAAGLVSGVTAGSATIIATVGSKQGQATITVTPPPVASVVVAPAAASLQVGGTQQLTATTLDAGGATLTGRVIAWASSDTAKATVSVGGLVTAKAAGTATITATSEGRSGTSLVTIIAPAPVATVTVAPATATVAVGGTVTLTATARDAGGNVLTGRTFAWSTSSASASLNATQTNVIVVNGVSAGNATITATSEGKSGASIVSVVASAPVVTSVAPATLTPGGAATITGTGFGATIGGNTVTIGGVSAAITAASATQLTATVPCTSSGTVPVIVSANGVSATAVTAALAVTTRTLAVGQSVALLDAPSVQCNELPVTGGRYIISVFSSSTTPSSNTGFTLRGAAAGSTASLVRSPMGITRDGTIRSRAVMTDAERQQAADARAHFAILEQNRQVYEQLRNAPGLAEARRAARTRQNFKSTIVPLTVGSAVTMKNRGLNGSCNSTATATGRVVAVTTRTVVIEDNASATAGQVDADLVAFGSLFENTMYPIEANFGDINAYDVPGGLENPGRVVMFFTPSENQPAAGGGQVMGHVSSCDLYPTTVSGAAGSNFTKIFYARTPVTLTGSAGTTDSRAWWNAGMPAVLVHEAKHLTANAERFARDANTLEESWLEEATAQIAVEIYSRSLYTGSGWKTNNTYAATVYCDARVGWPECPSGKRAMQSPFLYLLDYYKNNETKSILSPGSVDGDIYGSSWMFVRWLVDQYGGGTESTLLRALVQEANLAGVNNVTAKTGQAFTTLLADWTLTLVADDYPGFTPAAGAKYTFPSWNTRSIWSGFNTDFGSAYPVFPLITHPVAFGSFSTSATLSGAAAAIFELSGAQATKQLLDLSSLGLSTTIRVSILRVQ